ncbi:hypothetical protein HPB48_013416 [Haemaphysalis longicornis]|uniref:Carboxylesterase type B domain-containing protein n=1 Tax=Haemaphysalis longicornis TaxID=44386 RepID=A0A9J6G7Y8_HAELO|nr:hypothetical protein HPB48_013416 [Haemaphysalis longicornis]
MQSTGRSDEYDGRALAAFGDVVVVVPNSRLGVLGFLNLPVPGAPFNAGLLDQAEALNWTAHNIGFFGGDESDLVVVGDGSGASALAYHLLANERLTAFANVHKVVFMSESPLTRQGRLTTLPVLPAASAAHVRKVAVQAKSGHPFGEKRIIAHPTSRNLLSCWKIIK